MFMMTPWVKRILVVNVVMLLVTSTSGGLANDLAYYPPAAIFRPWTIVTYMFLHAGFNHLFFNMLGILIFGPRLEMKMGAKPFLYMYFAAGIGGALAQTAFATSAPMIGASAAVYAIVIGFAYYWPHEVLILFPIPIPVKAWVLATGYIALSVYQGVTGAANGVAHFAHLGGAAAGFAFIKWWEWRRGAAKRDFQSKMRPETSKGGFVGDRMALARWKGISMAGLHELNREEVERLLAKAQDQGPGALTAAEREYLDRMSGA
jgi:rhomboid family protein